MVDYILAREKWKGKNENMIFFVKQSGQNNQEQNKLS